MKHKKLKEFCEMTKPEKKVFLTMDLADRMIRVEQKVSAHFKKHLNYKDTDYYKSLSSSDKQKYENFRKYKMMKGVLVSFFIVLPIILILMLNIDMTAQIIKTNFGINDLDTAQFIILTSTAIFIIIAVYSAIRNHALENKENQYISLLDKLHAKRPLRKKH